MINENTDIEFKYLIVNESDKRYGITVNTVGFQTIHPNETYPVKEHPEDHYFNLTLGRRLDEFQFVYITKGSGELTIEFFEKMKIKQGHLIVLFPGQWHTYHPNKLIGWNEYYVGFNGDIIQKIFKNSFLTTRNQVVEIGLNEELVELFKRALEIVYHDRIGLQQHLSGIIMHMIGLIQYVSNNKRIEYLNYQQLIVKAKIIMVENIFNNLSTVELANAIGMKYNIFRRVFRQITGFAPAQYFQELKMRKAKLMLIETSCLVKEISYSLNYRTVDGFVTLFKKQTGYTPTEYRKFCR